MTGNLKLAFLFFILFVVACEGTAPVNDLNIPMGLEVTATTSSSITIKFYAYNPETDFSGFNVYISTALTTRAALQAVVSSRISGTAFTTAGDPYIISSSSTVDNQYPTLPANNYSDLTTEVVSIEHTITYDGVLASISTGTYYIVVTALDKSNTIESEASNMASAVVP